MADTLQTIKILKYIAFGENVRISIKISLKYAPKGPVDSKVALVQVMTWHPTSARLWYLHY